MNTRLVGLTGTCWATNENGVPSDQPVKWSPPACSRRRCERATFRFSLVAFQKAFGDRLVGMPRAAQEPRNLCCRIGRKLKRRWSSCLNH